MSHKDTSNTIWFLLLTGMIPARINALHTVILLLCAGSIDGFLVSSSVRPRSEFVVRSWIRPRSRLFATSEIHSARPEDAEDRFFYSQKSFKDIGIETTMSKVLSRLRVSLPSKIQVAHPLRAVFASFHSLNALPDSCVQANPRWKDMHCCRPNRHRENVKLLVSTHAGTLSDSSPFSMHTIDGLVDASQRTTHIVKHGIMPAAPPKSPNILILAPTSGNSLIAQILPFRSHYNDVRTSHANWQSVSNLFSGRTIDSRLHTHRHGNESRDIRKRAGEAGTRCGDTRSDSWQGSGPYPA